MRIATNHMPLLAGVLAKNPPPSPSAQQFRVRVDDQEFLVSLGENHANAPVVTKTVYNGYNPYADFNANSTLRTRYLYGNGIDTLIARVAANLSSPDYYLTDNLGSVRQIVGANGAVKDAINYSSFGKVLTETNAAQGDRFKYAGMEYEPTIDLSQAGF